MIAEETSIGNELRCYSFV